MSWRAARQRGPEEKKTPAGRTCPTVSGPGAGSQRTLRPPKTPAPTSSWLGRACPSVCPAPIALGLPGGHPGAPPGPSRSTHPCHREGQALPAPRMRAPSSHTHLPPPPLMSWKMAMGGRPASSCLVPTRASFTAS